MFYHFVDFLAMINNFYVLELFYFVEWVHQTIATEACSEFCQRSKMKLFVKIGNGFLPLTIFAKHSILDD